MKTSLVIFLSFLLLSTQAMDLSSMDLSSGPGEQLVEYIENMMLSVNTEQNTHQTVYTSQKEQCTTELAYRQKEVSDADSSLTAATNHKGLCDGALTQSKNDVENLKQQRTVIEGQIESLNDNRKRQKELFDEQEADINGALTAIAEAFDIIKQFKNSQPSGSAFLAEMGAHVTKRVKLSIGSKYFKHYAPIIAFVAQAGKDVAISEADLEHLKELFRKLETSLQTSLSSIRTVEQTRIEEYNTSKAGFEANIVTINNAIDEFEAYILTMRSCLNTESSIISEASSKLTRNKGILDSTTLMCASFDKEYNDASESRKQKFDNLTLLKTLIETKVADYEAGSTYAGDLKH